MELAEKFCDWNDGRRWLGKDGKPLRKLALAARRWAWKYVAHPKYQQRQIAPVNLPRPRRRTRPASAVGEYNPMSDEERQAFFGNSR